MIREQPIGGVPSAGKRDDVRWPSRMHAVESDFFCAEVLLKLPVVVGSA